MVEEKDDHNRWYDDDEEEEDKEEQRGGLKHCRTNSYIAPTHTIVPPFLGTIPQTIVSAFLVYLQTYLEL